MPLFSIVNRYPKNDMPLGTAGDRVRTGAVTVAEVPLTLTFGAGRPLVFGATGIEVNSPGAGVAVGDTTGELSGGVVFVGVGVALGSESGSVHHTPALNQIDYLRRTDRCGQHHLKNQGLQPQEL